MEQFLSLSFPSLLVVAFELPVFHPVVPQVPTKLLIFLQQPIAVLSLFPSMRSLVISETLQLLDCVFESALYSRGKAPHEVLFVVAYQSFVILDQSNKEEMWFQGKAFEWIGNYQRYSH